MLWRKCTVYDAGVISHIRVNENNASKQVQGGLKQDQISHMGNWASAQRHPVQGGTMQGRINVFK